MRKLGPLLLALAALTTVSGCRSFELLEAEMRSLEKDLNELKCQLLRTESENESLHRELHHIRQAKPGEATPPEVASQQFGLRQLALGRGTGGFDDDGCPGDEGVQLVVEPRDGDGHTLKAPGTLHVEALAVSPEGLKTPISAWDVSPGQLRRTWRSGWLSTGYHVVLPWQTWPTAEKVRLVARLNLADGRVFEAEKDVTVRPTAAAMRRPLPPAVDATVPAPDGPELTLPPPRKVSDVRWPGNQTTWQGEKGPAVTLGQVQPTSLWHPKKQPPINEAVELLRPVPLSYMPGENPTP
jgi:hypothetical protein